MNLKVLLHGNVVFENTLNTEKEYIAGRGKNSDIPLLGTRGVSRQHVKIYYTGENWAVELISQYGGLIHNNINCENLLLDSSDNFTVNEFEFIFELEEASPSANLSHSQSDKEIQLEESYSVSSASNASYSSSQDIEVAAEISDSGNLESTAPGHSTLDIELVIQYPTGETDKLKLEGNAWTAGRDPNCEIYVRNDNISRKHFEIERHTDGFYITDLGSSNGTKVNQETISANESFKIESGDCISIKKVTIDFYLKDNNLNEMMQSIEAKPLQAPAIWQQPENVQQNTPAQSPYVYNDNLPSVEKIQATPFKVTDFSNYETKHKIRFIAFLLLPFIAYMLFSEPEKEVKLSSKGTDKKNVFDGLSPEQKNSIKHSLELAQSNYNRGQFSTCLAEIEKIHSLVPNYSKSSQIQTYCQNGLDLKRMQEEKAQREEERRQVEEKVSSITTLCMEKIASFNSVEEAELCLSEAMELNPEAPEIYEIKDIVQSKIDALKAQQQNKIRYGNQKAQGERLYRKAVTKYKSKDLKTAIKFYKRFLASNYPDPKNNKAKAKKTLASVNQELSILINDGIRECRALLKNEKYKQAMIKCIKTEKQDPGNKKIAASKATIRKQLSIKMKEFYDNASIEESFGNIEAASELWRKIMATDFKGGSGYYEKSKSKMNKYGL